MFNVSSVHESAGVTQVYWWSSTLDFPLPHSSTPPLFSFLLFIPSSSQRWTGIQHIMSHIHDKTCSSSGLILIGSHSFCWISMLRTRESVFLCFFRSEQRSKIQHPLNFLNTFSTFCGKAAPKVECSESLKNAVWFFNSFLLILYIVLTHTTHLNLHRQNPWLFCSHCMDPLSSHVGTRGVQSEKGRGMLSWSNAILNGMEECSVFCRSSLSWDSDIKTSF